MATPPIECGRVRETISRSLAGCAGYGYCGAHSRRSSGLRLHLVITTHGLVLIVDKCYRGSVTKQHPTTGASAVRRPLTADAA